MRYNSISNDMMMRRRITPSSIFMDNVFTPNEVDDIDAHCFGDLSDAKVANEGAELNRGIRESKINFVSRNDENTWIFEKFNQFIYNINQGYYGFDLYGYDVLQYTVYEGESQGHYDWHSDLLYGKDLGDTLYNSTTRKLSLVMLLNEPQEDFTGGEFQLNLGRESEATTVEMTKGSIVVFPSFILHRVKPVLSGVRKSLVIWVEGPKFR